MAEIKKINPAIPVIIMTAFSSVQTAVDALKNGAYDYLTKPFDFDKLKVTIQRSLEHTRLKKKTYSSGRVLEKILTAVISLADMNP